MSGHAFLAPSSAPQWGPGRCSGAPTLQASFPDSSGEEALEGNAAHDWAAASILGNAPSVGTVHENGQTITPLMADQLSDYIADCRALTVMVENVKAMGQHAHYGVEQKLIGHTFIHPQNEGTPDFWAVFWEQRKVILKDLKFGHGFVGAFRNFQLANYLLMIFETLGLGYPDDTWTIEAAIYQPRNYHPSGPIRFWRPMGSELGRLRLEFVQAAHEATGPTPICRTGDWCRYCTARIGCTTLIEDASFSRSHAGSAQIHYQDPRDLGRELKANKRAMAVLKARTEALEEQATALVAKGARVWGWRGEYRDGRTTWSVTPERVIAWCKALGADVSKPSTLTPTQALKQGLTMELIDAITTTPTTYALVEVTGDDLAKGFSENG